jgi:hypothetical protein
MYLSIGDCEKLRDSDMKCSFGEASDIYSYTSNHSSTPRVLPYADIFPNLPTDPVICMLGLTNWEKLVKFLL